MTSFLSKRKAVPKEIRIAIGADHGGFTLKETIKKYLEGRGYSVHDYGTFSPASVDYPDFAKKVAKAITSGECERGILLCRNGIGMSIAANRFKNVRAVTCYDVETAKSSRVHDNTNVLSLGADFLDEKKATEIVDSWIRTEFDDSERRVRRIRMIDDMK